MKRLLDKKEKSLRSEQRLEEARRISEGMRKLNPDGYAAAEAVVRKRIAIAQLAGAFGRPPTKH